MSDQVDRVTVISPLPGLIVLVTAGLLACGSASKGRAPTVLARPDYEEVVLQDDGGRTTVTTYLPRVQDPAPAAMLLPGGRGAAQVGTAWKGYHLYAKALAERGIVASVVDYARAGRGLVDERRLQELSQALEVLQRSPAIDPKRIFVLGFSMGGVNGILLSGDHPEIAGLVTFYSPVDWRFDRPGEPPSVAKQPIEYVSQLRCRVLILQGDADEVTPVAQASRFLDALERADVPAQLQIFPGGGHGFIAEGAPPGPCCRFDRELVRRSLDHVVRFVFEG